MVPPCIFSIEFGSGSIPTFDGKISGDSGKCESGSLASAPAGVDAVHGG